MISDESYSVSITHPKSDIASHHFIQKLKHQAQKFRFLRLMHQPLGINGVVFKKLVLDPDSWDHLQILDCLLNKRPANSDGLHVNLFWNKNMFAKRVGESISNKLSNYLDLGGQHHVFLGPPWAILALGPGPHFRIQN